VVFLDLKTPLHESPQDLKAGITVTVEGIPPRSSGPVAWPVKAD